MSTNQAWSRVMLALMMMSCGAFGQAASDPGEGLRAVPSDVAGVTAVKWWGKLGRSYFVQSSETLLPGSWQYMPVVEDGTDGVCTYNLQTSAERMFVRLVYTDQAPAGGAAAADFDGDGIANHLEVSSSVGLNPLDALQDEDGDGMPDAWEMQHALSRFDGSDGGENGPMPAMPVAPTVPVVPNPQSFYFPDSMGVLVWTDASQTAYDAALENYDLEMAAYPDAAAVFLNMWNLWSAARLRHDPDNDGLSNVREYHAGSDPWVADTDGDGFNDGVEVEHGSLPALASSTPPFRLDVISGNLQEIIAGTSSSEVLLLASRAGQPLAGKAVRFESGSATLLLQPVGGGSAGAIVTMTTNAQGQVAVTLQAPASPALGLVSLAAELTEHAGVAAGFQAAVVEPGLSFLRPDVWAWLSGSGGSSPSPGGMQTFVPGATAVVLSRSSAVAGGTYSPGTPSTVVPGPPEKNGPPVERTDQPNLDEYNSTAGETEHFSVVQELVGYDEDDQPIFEPRYSWRKQRMKPGPSVTIPGTPASVTAFEASNEKYANGKLVIETAEQVAAKAPKPKFSGAIAGYLGFGELTTEDRKNRGSAGDQLDARAGNGDYDTGRWRQIWLFTGVPATEDVAHSFLIKTTSGSGEEEASSYSTLTLTVKKGQSVSTEGDVEGQVPGVSVTDGVASIQPAVPGSDGSAVRIEVIPIEIQVPYIQETGPILAANGTGNGMPADSSPPPTSGESPAASSGSFEDPVVTASELMIARMEGTYSGGQLTRDALDANNFLRIDNDPNRFRLRIAGLGNANVGPVFAKISTVGATHPEHDDDVTIVELKSNGFDGEWVTDWQLLVSQNNPAPSSAGVSNPAPTDADDRYTNTEIATDDQDQAEGQIGDRTHVAELGSDVVVGSFKFGSSWVLTNIRVPVKVKREIPITFVQMEDASADITRDLKIANERWAQVGIKFKSLGTTPMAVPPPLTNSDIMASDTTATGVTFGWQPKKLADAYSALPGAKVVDGTHIVVFYCKDTRYPGGTTSRGQDISGFATYSAWLNGTYNGGGSSPTVPGYENLIFMSETHWKPFTLAHELGHLLTNEGHFGRTANDDYPSTTPTQHAVNHNLMIRGTSQRDGIGVSKRLIEGQRTMVERATNGLTQ